MDSSALSDLVKRGLPDIEEDKLDNVVSYLLAQGVKRERDLRHFTVAMLQTELDLVDASDLYEEWQRNYNPPSTSSAGAGAGPGPSTSSSSTNSASTSRPQANLQTAARQQLSIVLPQFDVESGLFPAEVRKAILGCVRPPDQARVSMVDRIVDYCREKVPGFVRGSCKEVAIKLVELYPDSFKDTVPVSKHGSDGLLRQFQIKFDNEKRPHIALPQEKQAPAVKEAFGCLMYDPPLPEKETVESLTRKREELKSMFKVSRKDWEWRPIKKKMEETYYLQRQDILSSTAPQKPVSRKRKRGSKENVDPTENDVAIILIPKMMENWPFLFTSQGINQHFKILTGVNFHDKFKDYVRDNSNYIIEFLACQHEDFAKIKRRMERAERAGCGAAKTVALLLLLIRQFGDERTSLVRYIESTTTFEELHNYKDFPQDKTPFLLAAGTSLYDFENLYLSIDNNFVCSVNNVSEGFTMLFSAYFIFGIEYSDSLVNLLNFTQRVIAEIREPKGTKCSNAALNRKSNDKMVRFMNRLAGYIQRVSQEEDGEEDD